MTTLANYSTFTASNNCDRWSKSSKRSHYTNKKKFRNNGHLHFCGNRRDPLNLNELIRRKQQSIVDDDHHREADIYGNDRPIELLLEPNIFDPLCLDVSSYKNENSISFNSTHQ